MVKDQTEIARNEYAQVEPFVGMLPLMKFWFPAGVGFLCQGFGMGLMGIFGFFVLPLSQEFDVGTAVINTGPALLILLPALASPLIGRMADRISIRRMLLTGVVISAIGLVSASVMDSLFAVFACTVIYALGMGLYGPVTINAMLIKFYRARVARALAIAAIGVSLGAVVLPLSTAWLMEAYGWRETLRWLILSIAAVLLPAILLGLPDKIGGDAGQHSEAEEDPEAAAGLRAALRTRSFWLVGIAIALVFNMSLLMTVCYPPHFQELGFTAAQAASFLATAGVGGFIGKMVVAVFADHWRAYTRFLAVGLLVVGALALLLLTNSDHYLTIALATAAVGFCAGGMNPLHPFLNSQYFSIDIIGRVNGAQIPMLLPLAMVAAPLAGYAYDTTGTFLPAFHAMIGLLVVAMLLLLMLPAPAPINQDGDGEHG